MKKLNSAVIKSRLPHLFLYTLLVFGLMGCGQTGPLYFPDEVPKSQRAKK